MSAKRDPVVYLEDIQNSINLIFQYINNKTESDIKNSQEIQDAILLRFEIIGEASSQLPADFKKKYPNVPWQEMADTRNKIIHEYFGLNWYIIWKTITDDLPLVKKYIEDIIEDSAT